MFRLSFILLIFSSFLIAATILESEPNDSCAQADVITIFDTGSGSVRYNNDRLSGVTNDVWTFTTPSSGGSLQIYTTGYSTNNNADTDGFLYSGNATNCTNYYTSTNGGCNTSSGCLAYDSTNSQAVTVTYTVAANTKYFFSLNAYNSNGNNPNPYVLNFTFTSNNHAPTITQPNNGNAYTLSVPENTTAVTDVNATDSDNDTLTYTLSGTDASHFDINASTGVITFATAPDYEVPTDVGADNVYNITVTVTDSGYPTMSDTQNIAVTVTNVIEVPNLTTCWVETFTDPSLVGKWNVSGTGYTPQVTAGRLRLTPASGNIATLATLSGELPANDNFIEIEFDQFAYSGSGADGMTLTLSNAAMTPVSGASGGSLGYAQKTGVNGFAGGWLGFGIDEYGNFSSQSEGRVGGETASDSNSGDREIDSFAIRGSGSGTSGYPYLTGTTTLTPQIDNNSNGHQYKLSIDTRVNQTWVKVERKTSSSGSYIEIIPWYNATQSATAPQNFRLSLTASTGGATNIHEADNFNLKALSCGSIGIPVPQTNFVFDAWDSFRSLSDRNISTKIVGKSFDLNISSLDSTKTALQDFNGTVCSKIVDNAGNALSGWNKSLFNTTKSATTTFTLNRAIGGTDSAGVKLYWKKNVDSVCPIVGEDNSSMASDRFSARPASFVIASPNAVAGINFDINFTAPIYGAVTPSSDYNETSGNSFQVTVSEHNTSCATGVFNPAPTSFSFTNGSKTLTTRYSEVGVLDVNITDVTKSCGARYTNVDCDDANVSDGTNFTANLLPIGTATKSITIKPHHFDVTGTLSNFGGGNFTYLSDDLNMSAQLDLNITAKNGEGNTTLNYNANCYAQDTTLTLLHTTVPDPLTKILYAELLSSVSSNTLKANPLTFTFDSLLFNAGSILPNIDLNFDRSPAKPLNPFDFNITSATATDTDAVTGTTVPLGNAKFVYGRVHAYDIATNVSPVKVPVEFEVYSTAPGGFVTGMPQNILKWYRNLNHDTAGAGNVVRGGFSAGTSDSAINTSAAPADGLQLIEVTSTTDQTVHLDITPWLWYSPNYTYDYSGNCTRHPCFNYDYTDATAGVKGVNSGTYQGSDFQMTPAKNITNKGVKLFR